MKFHVNETEDGVEVVVRFWLILTGRIEFDVPSLGNFQQHLRECAYQPRIPADRRFTLDCARDVSIAERFFGQHPDAMEQTADALRRVGLRLYASPPQCAVFH